MPQPDAWYPPLLHRITAQSDSRLVAESDFDPQTDPFIAQHVLYAAQVSDIDPGLQALPVLPLAVSLEMVVEAAAVLTGSMATRLEQVRARDWIAFDTGPATLTTVAEIIQDGPEQCLVAVRILRGDALLFEALAICAPPLPATPLPPLTAPQAPYWRDEDLYTTGMFHGPLFRGVASLLQWDAGGLDAGLTDTPLDGFFSAGERPENLLLNPVLLDQIGHVTAFWIAQGAGTDFSSFPSSIDRIDLFAPRTEATAGTIIAGRIGFRDAQDAPVSGPEQARFLQGDFTCAASDGTPLLQVSGWRDRFFRVPHSFYEARYRPRESWYGAPLLTPFQDQPADVLVWSIPAFPPGFLEDAGGIWLRMLAATVLSANERITWRGLTGTGKRRRDWLMGRIALKEAARAWILQQHGIALLPADLEVAVAPGGKPYLTGPLDGIPEVSLSHAGGAALAVAAPPGQAVGIDMELPGSVSPDLLAEAAFSAQEQALLGVNGPGAPDAGQRLLRGWCAKEAAAKALGQGLTGRPRAFVLQSLSADGAQASVRAPGGITVQVALAHQADIAMALARC